MSVLLQPSAPGGGAHLEDRLFHRLLATTLTLLLLVGSIVPNILLPQMPLDRATELPPRLARILTVGSAALTDTATEARRTQAEAPSVAPQPATTQRPAEQQPSGLTSPAVPVRRRLDETGVLALGDVLAQLHNAAPNLIPPKTIPSDSLAASRNDGQSGAARSEILTAGVTAGSGGTDVDTSALQQLLRAPGLQAEVVGGAGPRVEGGIIESLSAANRHVSTTAGRSEEEIQKILNRNKSAIYKLYNRELSMTPSLRGKLVLSIMIAPSGQVTRARIIYSELHSESLQQRLIQLIQRIDFGAKPGVPAVTTNVPIEFFPV